MPKRTLVAYLLSLLTLIALVGCVCVSLPSATSRAPKPATPEPSTEEPAASAPSMAEPASPGPQQGQSLAGVWMGLVSYWAVTGRYTPSPEYLVMYEDGSFYYEMPLEGLQSFDREKSRREEVEYWGTYAFDGASGSWQRATYEPSELELDENDVLQVQGSPFYRCAPVDGLRLEGAWTTYADPTDPDLSRGGVQPIIRFSADGRFQDEGLFESGLFLLPEAPDDGSVDAQAVAPGKGTYEIENYTLTLKYDDGRVRRAAFSLYLSTKPEPSPGIIFIYRVDLNRM